MLFGKLMMQKPNILIMDEPTNHLDMESIESLNMALEMYQGTLIFRFTRPRVRQLAGDPRPGDHPRTRDRFQR